MMHESTPKEAIAILDFWWSAGPERWFSANDGFDAECESGFRQLLDKAQSGALDDWTSDATATLALIILLDQMPRNIFRGTPQAFATDEKAARFTDLAVGRGYHLCYPVPQRRFFYMPFMHLEDMVAQQRSVDINRAANDKDGYHYALIHLDVIRRFGRFPHRNALLGRESTQAEVDYLASGGFSG